MKLTKDIYWLLLFLVLTGGNTNAPIPIGLAAELTGRRAELGVAARDPGYAVIFIYVGPN